jgi:hypothetical protein
MTEPKPTTTYIRIARGDRRARLLSGVTRAAFTAMATVHATGDADDPALRWFISSTDVKARDRRVIDQATWKLDYYRSNPVVLFAHKDDQPPIGRAEYSGVHNGQLVEGIRFDTALELGATMMRQYDEGFINAVSVRWGDAEYSDRRALDKHDPYYSPEGGVLIRHADKFETSVVPVPADALALGQRSIDSLREWMRANVPVDEEGRMPWMDVGQVRAVLEGDPRKLPWLK